MIHIIFVMKRHIVTIPGHGAGEVINCQGWFWDEVFAKSKGLDGNMFELFQRKKVFEKQYFISIWLLTFPCIAVVTGNPSILCMLLDIIKKAMLAVNAKRRLSLLLHRKYTCTRPIKRYILFQI